MNVLVTGAAGFIGSRLCQALLDRGDSVRGLDAFIDTYPRWIKEKNLAPLKGRERFEFLEFDLNRLDLKGLLGNTEAVCHMAAQAGVRSSWGGHFHSYLQNNIQNTQSLLEAARDAGLSKFLFASSSSVYGLTPDLPMKETSPLLPHSPYGVTKLAAEQLCLLYHRNDGLPVVCLRFFTVFGPGQRPDMAFHRFFKSTLEGGEITVYGDGSQTRDFTFVDDIVAACLAGLEVGREGEVYNIGGGHRERLEDVFPVIEEICRLPLRLRFVERQKGDVPDTLADIDKARRELDYSPGTPLRQGLAREWGWIREIYRT